MRLLIHNMLTSRVKGVKKGYPFRINVRRVFYLLSNCLSTCVSVYQATKVEEKSVDFNAEFIARMISRIEWDALKQAAESVRLESQSRGSFTSISFCHPVDWSHRPSCRSRS